MDRFELEHKEKMTVVPENFEVAKDEHHEHHEYHDRGHWSQKSDYILSMVGYGVGLGNVWRFPYLIYQDGGGAFLIPYTIMMILAGLPLFFLECSLGQFTSLGPVSVWRSLPLFQGVGIAMVFISILVSIYYNVIIAYSLFYLFASFQKVLPWAECFEWADSYCSHTATVTRCNVSMEVGVDGKKNYTLLPGNNDTCENGTWVKVPGQLPTEQYWDKVVLQRSSGMDDTGVIVWPLALCLLLAWIIVGGAMFNGIRFSGKVVYSTAVLPYVVLLLMLLRGATLEGAYKGISYYFGKHSNFTKLKEGTVWKDAATQIFYSLSLAWGGLVTLSSYNQFNNNCYSDSILLCLINCVTSVFAGFTIFSILGHMAHKSGKEVSQVVKSGFDMAFIAYPEALAHLPFAPFWSVLFFFMLLTLGLDSQFASVETFITTIQDFYYPMTSKLRPLVTWAWCMFLFLAGLICVTQAGIYWIHLMDHFCAGWTIIILALLELIGIIWIYGGNRFIEDIEMMIGPKRWIEWLFWRACWYFITPFLFITILIWSLVTFQNPEYGDIPYPTWSLALGWFLIAFSLLWIPVMAIVKMMRAKGTLVQRFLICCRPAYNWGPYLKSHRHERYKDMACPKKKYGRKVPPVRGDDKTPK